MSVTAVSYGSATPIRSASPGSAQPVNGVWLSQLIGMSNPLRRSCVPPKMAPAARNSAMAVKSQAGHPPSAAGQRHAGGAQARGLPGTEVAQQVVNRNDSDQG